MGLLNSLKKLFGTSKDISTAKAAELKVVTVAKAAVLKDATSAKATKFKAKAVKGVERVKVYTQDVVEKIDDVVDDAKIAAQETTEKVIDFGENLKDKAELAIGKLDDKAAGFVDKLEVKIRGTANETKIPADEPIIEQAIKKSEEEPGITADVIEVKATEIVDEAEEQVDEINKGKAE